MSENNVLPPRFREKAFRRYEDDIARAVQFYPESIFIDPKVHELSPVTVAQRFRDSKKSYLDNKWESKKINRTRFEAVENDLIVRETMDGLVKVGPSKELLQPVSYRPINEDEPFPVQKWLRTQDVLDMTNQGTPEINFLCFLASKRALAVKVKISIDESSVESLYDSYDINLDRQEDGSYILT